jgi:hypothetical protein
LPSSSGKPWGILLRKTTTDMQHSLLGHDLPSSSFDHLEGLVYQAPSGVQSPFSICALRLSQSQSQLEVGVTSLCWAEDTAGLQWFPMIKAFQDILIHTRSFKSIPITSNPDGKYSTGIMTLWNHCKMTEW